MTAQLRTTLKGRFENGDTPQGSDYVDLFDSFLSLIDTSTQTIVSPVVINNTLGVTDLSAQTMETSALTVNTTITVNADTTATVSDVASAKEWLAITVSGQTRWIPLHS